MQQPTAAPSRKSKREEADAPEGEEGQGSLLDNAGGTSDTPTARASPHARALMSLAGIYTNIYIFVHLFDFATNAALMVAWTISGAVPARYLIASWTVMFIWSLVYALCLFGWYQLPPEYEAPCADNNWEGRMKTTKSEGIWRRLMKGFFGEYVTSFDAIYAFKEKSDFLTRALVDQCIRLPVQQEVLSAREACVGTQMLFARAVLPASLRTVTEAPVLCIIQMFAVSTGVLDHAPASLNNLAYISIFFGVLASVPIGIFVIFSRPICDIRTVLFVSLANVYMLAGLGYYLVSLVNREYLREEPFTLFVYCICAPALFLALNFVCWVFIASVFSNPTWSVPMGHSARETPVVLFWFLEGEPTLAWKRWRAWAEKQEELMGNRTLWQQQHSIPQGEGGTTIPLPSPAANPDRIREELRGASEERRSNDGGGALAAAEANHKPSDNGGGGSAASASSYMTNDARFATPVESPYFSPWAMNPEPFGGKYRWLIFGAFAIHIVASIMIYGIMAPRTSLPITGVLAFVQFLALLCMVPFGQHVYRVCRFRHATRRVFAKLRYIPFRELLQVMEGHFSPGPATGPRSLFHDGGGSTTAGGARGGRGRGGGGGGSAQRPPAPPRAQQQQQRANTAPTQPAPRTAPDVDPFSNQKDDRPPQRGSDGVDFFATPSVDYKPSGAQPGQRQQQHAASAPHEHVAIDLTDPRARQQQQQQADGDLLAAPSLLDTDTSSPRNKGPQQVQAPRAW